MQTKYLLGFANSTKDVWQMVFEVFITVCWNLFNIDYRDSFTIL